MNELMTRESGQMAALFRMRLGLCTATPSVYKPQQQMLTESSPRSRRRKSHWTCGTANTSRVRTDQSVHVVLRESGTAAPALNQLRLDINTANRTRPASSASQNGCGIFRASHGWLSKRPGNPCWLKGETETETETESGRMNRATEEEC